MIVNSNRPDVTSAMFNTCAPMSCGVKLLPSVGRFVQLMYTKSVGAVTAFPLAPVNSKYCGQPVVSQRSDAQTSGSQQIHSIMSIEMCGADHRLRRQ